MKDFNYYAPTEVVFGKESEEQVAALVKKYNGTKVLVHEGIALCQKEGVDFILAVGGGSVIDSGKAIAMGVANVDKEVWDFYLGKDTPAAALPVASVLTIPAAGSEMKIKKMVRKCSRDYTATCGSLKKLQAQDMEAIYKMARG